MSATEITRVEAWEVLDSRGNPTVACEVTLAGGARADAAVPSGASTGEHEALELRDGGERYGGRGVRTAVGNVVHELADAVVGRDAAHQDEIDAALREADGTADLGRLGANAVLAVSLATALAAARANGAELHEWLGGDPLLPMPMVNVISGGAHAGGAVDIQDFLVIPVGASCFAEALEWAWRVRSATQQVTADRGLPAALVADEGGIGVPLPSNRAALELLAEGIGRSGLVPGDEVAIAIDVAATQLWRDERYHLLAEGRDLSAAELVEELLDWAEQHPVCSIEDPLADDDWRSWPQATAALGHLQVVGDDLFVTDTGRLARGVAEGVANAVLVKPNQTGTLTGAHDVVTAAQAAGYATVVSARSGETEDSWLADLAVGWRAGQIKVGSTTRSERTAKWNRLLRIEQQLGDRALFAGRDALSTKKRVG